MTVQDEIQTCGQLPSDEDLSGLSPTDYKPVRSVLARFITEQVMPMAIEVISKWHLIQNSLLRPVSEETFNDLSIHWS